MDYKKQASVYDGYWKQYVDKEVIQLSKNFDNALDNKDIDMVKRQISIASKLLRNQNNKPTNMQLNYNIANGYSYLGELEHKYYFEKEIYFYRMVINIFEDCYPSDDESENYVANLIAMRSYTNLANAMKVIGRFISAIDLYHEALLINNAFSMASLNLSISLFRYSSLQINDYEQFYFQHAAYYYYEQCKKHKVNLEEESYLAQIEHGFINKLPRDYIDNKLKKELPLPSFESNSDEERKYRSYILGRRLFLDPCCEILGEPCFAVDSLNLPIEAGINSRDDEFIGLFNIIKQEYIYARYLWYLTTI